MVVLVLSPRKVLPVLKAHRERQVLKGLQGLKAHRERQVLRVL
jgi:hypothetical protein